MLPLRDRTRQSFPLVEFLMLGAETNDFWQKLTEGQVLPLYITVFSAFAPLTHGFAQNWAWAKSSMHLKKVGGIVKLYDEFIRTYQSINTVWKKSKDLGLIAHFRLSAASLYRGILMIFTKIPHPSLAGSSRVIVNRY